MNELLKHNFIEEALKWVGIDLSMWVVIKDNALGEGHYYEIGGKYYEEVSDVSIRNEITCEQIELWVDVAWTPNMIKPIAYIEDAWPKEILTKYSITSNKLNPDIQLRTRLGAEFYSLLMQEEYFAERKHLNLTDKKEY